MLRFIVQNRPDEVTSTLDVSNMKGLAELEQRLIAGKLLGAEIVRNPAEESHSLEGELREVINRYSTDAYCQTPDYILAAFLAGSISNFRETVLRRDRHMGAKSLTPTGPADEKAFDPRAGQTLGEGGFQEQRLRIR